MVKEEETKRKTFGMDIYFPFALPKMLLPVHGYFDTYIYLYTIHLIMTFFRQPKNIEKKANNNRHERIPNGYKTFSQSQTQRHGNFMFCRSSNTIFTIRCFTKPNQKKSNHYFPLWLWLYKFNIKFSFETKNFNPKWKKAHNFSLKHELFFFSFVVKWLVKKKKTKKAIYSIKIFLERTFSCCIKIVSILIINKKITFFQPEHCRSNNGTKESYSMAWGL